MTVLETQSLSKHYQMGEVTVHALAGVDFRVEGGEFVAIMGPSGSGKSTLLHLLGGLDFPSSGEVYLNDQPLSSLNDDQITRLRRRKVGFIFQFYNLLPTLTAAENVALPLMIDGQPLARHRAHIDKLLELVDLADRADHLCKPAGNRPGRRTDREPGFAIGNGHP
jgi:putative ABC transport system ATP-binding protein